MGNTISLIELPTLLYDIQKNEVQSQSADEFPVVYGHAFKNATVFWKIPKTSRFLHAEIRISKLCFYSSLLTVRPSDVISEACRHGWYAESYENGFGGKTPFGD